MNDEILTGQEINNGVFLGEEIKDTLYIRCSFSFSNFYKSKFSKVVFRNCDFWECGFKEATFEDVVFINCKIRSCNMGATFKSCDFKGTTIQN